MKIPFTFHSILHGQVPPLHGAIRAYYVTAKEYTSVSQLIALFYSFVKTRNKFYFFYLL